MSREDAVYIKVDTERTDVDAYNQFTLDVLMEFDGDASIRQERERKLSKADPSVAAEAAEQLIVVAENVGRDVLIGYLVGQLEGWREDSSEDERVEEIEDAMVKTEEGDIHIEQLIVTSEDDAQELFDKQREQ